MKETDLLKEVKERLSISNRLSDVPNHIIYGVDNIVRVTMQRVNEILDSHTIKNMEGEDYLSVTPCLLKKELGVD